MFSPILPIFLALFTTCLAQNTAWIGCFEIPPEGLSGITVSSSQTWTPAGCAAECRNLPAAGFSPTTYAFYSAYVEIGDVVPGHCLCSNNPPLNDWYDPTTPSGDCASSVDYAATLVDTPVEFIGCSGTIYEDAVVYNRYVDTFPACFQACSQFRYIAVDHNVQQGQIGCRCSPFMFYDPETAVFCTGEIDNHLVYQNPTPQPSGSFAKRERLYGIHFDGKSVESTNLNYMLRAKQENVEEGNDNGNGSYETPEIEDERFDKKEDNLEGDIPPAPVVLRG